MRMSVTTTSAPALASARQSARPRPREPPVTTATLPVRSNIASSGARRPARGDRHYRQATAQAARPQRRRPVATRLRGLGHPRGPGGGAPLAADLPGDDQALELGGALPGLVDRCVAHAAPHPGLLAVA